MTSRILLSIISLLIVSNLFSLNLIGQKDSLKSFLFIDFMKIVLLEHPMIKKANLQPEKSAAFLQLAKGGFDPYLFNATKEKYLNDNQYYSLIKSGLKVPTWYGIEATVSNEFNKGYYLNPENQTGTSGLWQVGVSAPIGQGLFIDKRRAELKKATLYEQMSVFEQQILINDVLYEAGKTYWEWFASYHTYMVFEEAYSIAENRLAIIKSEAVIGEKPSIDTVEASIQLQNIRLNLNQAELNYTNARNFLSVFLWMEGLIPLEVDTTIIPEKSTLINENLIQIEAGNFSALQHPEISINRIKIDQMKIDYRMAKEQLKPVININYNLLNDSYINDFENYSVSNYKWGVDIAMPLFLRKARGDLKIKSISITEKIYETEYKTVLLNYKIIAAESERNLQQKQVELQLQISENLKALMESEKIMFAQGESSIFMVNTREQNFITAQVKYIELLNKYYKSILTLDFAKGNLQNNW